jgi:hypothetical protein
VCVHVYIYNIYIYVHVHVYVHDICPFPSLQPATHIYTHLHLGVRIVQLHDRAQREERKEDERQRPLRQVRHCGWLGCLGAALCVLWCWGSGGGILAGCVCVCVCVCCCCRLSNERTGGSNAPPILFSSGGARFRSIVDIYIYTRLGCVCVFVRMRVMKMTLLLGTNIMWRQAACLRCSAGEPRPRGIASSSSAMMMMIFPSVK